MNKRGRKLLFESQPEKMVQNSSWLSVGWRLNAISVGKKISKIALYKVESTGITT